MPTSENSEYEQRVQALINAFEPMPNANITPRKLAERYLAAVGIKKPGPTWPTSVMVRLFRASYQSCTNQNLNITDWELADCMRHAYAEDPNKKIVDAAIALRDVDKISNERGGVTNGQWEMVMRSVINAVNEAYKS